MFIYGCIALLCSVILRVGADIPTWTPSGLARGIPFPINDLTIALTDMNDVYNSGYTYLQLLRQTRQASATAVWWNTRQQLQNGFEVDSSFSITPDTTGRGIANGFAYVFQNYGASNTTVGTNANQLGLPLLPAVAVIFNTWEQWAGICVISGNGVDTDCSSAERVSLPPPFNGTWSVTIRYQANTPTLSATFSSNSGAVIVCPPLSVNITAAIGSPDGYGFVGLTAATGGAVMDLKIQSYGLVTNRYAVPLINFGGITAAFTDMNDVITPGNSYIRLLRQSRQASAVCVWWNQQVTWKYGFTVYASYRVLQDQTGLGYDEGIAFAFQNYGVSSTTVQRNGDGFGLMTKPGGLAMPTALAVAHDFWQQWIGVCQITNGTNSQSCPPSGQVNVGAPTYGSFTATITWTPNTSGSALGVLTATFTGPNNAVWSVPATTLDINVATNSNTGMGWVGITGSTGGPVMDLLVDSYVFIPAPAPTAGPTPAPTIPAMTTTGSGTNAPSKPTSPPTNKPPTTAPTMPGSITTGSNTNPPASSTGSGNNNSSAGTSAPTIVPAVYTVTLNLSMSGNCTTMNSSAMATAIQTDFSLPTLPSVDIVCPPANNTSQKRAASAASAFHVVVVANNVPATSKLASGSSAQVTAAVTSDLASPTSAAGLYVQKSGNTFQSATAAVTAVAPAPQKTTSSGSSLACGAALAIVLGSAVLLI